LTIHNPRRPTACHIKNRRPRFFQVITVLRVQIRYSVSALEPLKKLHDAHKATCIPDENI